MKTGGINDQPFRLIKNYIYECIYCTKDFDFLLQMLEIIIIEKQPHKAGPQWKFAGSFYYALVVLSLIGYGHSTPKTLLGKGKAICIRLTDKINPDGNKM